MKKIIIALFILSISLLSANAFEYELYNPQTKETTSASMMSIESQKKDNTYYIGFYTYNLYCIAGKDIKKHKRLKSGTCYPFDYKSGEIDNLSNELPEWREKKSGNFDEERNEIAKEQKVYNLKEVPFIY